MRDFFINLDAQRTDGGFVQSFSQNIPAVNLPQFARSDNFPIRLLFVRETQDITQNLPFYFVDPAGFSSVKFAGGEIGATPDGGTFTLTSSVSGTTTALAYNASAVTVQTALRLIGGLTACTVSGSAGGPFTVDSQDTANGGMTITGNAAALAPDGSTVVIVKTQAANGSLTNRWSISLAKAYPILITTGWAALPAAGVVVSTVQVGSSTQNKTFQVEWNADAYAGTVMLTFTGDTTTGSIGPIPFSANADAIAAAFAKHVDILVPAGVGVVKNSPGKWTVTMLGAGIANSNTPTLATSSNTLQVPVGLTADCPVSTAGADALLGSADSVDITIEVEVRETSGHPNTAAQATTQLLKDLIVNTPGNATGSEDWVTAGDIKQDNTLFVDQAFGSDVTGAREFLSKPFQTLNAAKTAASSGDLIIVRPGNFSERNLLKNGVNWYFEPGAIVDYIGSFDGSVWSDASDGANAAVTCKITGYGSFAFTGTPADAMNPHAVFRISNASSEVYVECLSITNTTPQDNSNSAVLTSAGIITVLASGNLASTTYDALLCNGGEMNVECREIQGADDGIEISDGVLNLRCFRVSTGGSGGVINLIGGSALLECDYYSYSGDGNAFLFCDTSGGFLTVNGGSAIGIVVHSSGTLTFNGTRIDNSANVAAVISTSAAGVILNSGCVLIAEGASDSITAGSAQNVKVYGTVVTNRAKNANITILVGTLLVSSDVT